MDILTLSNPAYLLECYEQVLKRKAYKKFYAQAIRTFGENLEANVSSLSVCLRTGMYESQAVRYVGHKKPVALLDFRDYLVAHALLAPLQGCLAPYIHEASCAYEKGKGIFSTIDQIKNQIQNQQLETFIKADVKGFFPSIPCDRLKEKLRPWIKDPYCYEILCALIDLKVSQGGQVVTGQNGLILGSPLSPLLSNVYMHGVDDTFSHLFPLYYRYSDDMFFCGKEDDYEAIQVGLDQIQETLKSEGLILNDEKTHYGLLSEGVSFLGCYLKNRQLDETTMAYQIMRDGYRVKDLENLECSELVAFVVLFYLRQENIAYEAVLRPDIYEKEIALVAGIPVELDWLSRLDRLMDQLIEQGRYELAESVLSLARYYERHHLKDQVTEPVFKAWCHCFHMEKAPYFIGEKKDGFRHYEMASAVLTYEGFCDCLSRRQSIAKSVIESEKVHAIVLDIDIQKQVLLAHKHHSQVMKPLLGQAFNFANKLVAFLEAQDLVAYRVFSGYKGYHVWLFLEKPLDLVGVRPFKLALEGYFEPPKGISLEIFPTMEESDGEKIKLPYTYHELSGQMTYFVDGHNHPIAMTKEFLETITQNHPNRILEAPFLEPKLTPSKDNEEPITLDHLPHYIEETIQTCSVLKAIVQKAVKQRYLTHFERYALLYVLGHMGDLGVKTLHVILSYCMNYDVGITEGFISRLQPCPVSCQKLNLRFNQYPCRCQKDFGLYPLFYPSPVLIGYEILPDVVTPSAYVDQEQRIQEVIQLKQTLKVDEITGKMMAAMKAQGEIEAEISQYKETLNGIFARENCHAYPTEYGDLVKVDDTWMLKLKVK